MTIAIRPLLPGDFGEADSLVRAAFERDANFQPMLRLHSAIEPTGLWAAWLETRMVGTASAVDYGGVAYLGLMTVHPELQRRGVGAQLLEHALAWLDARGCPVTLLDATDKGAPLYQRYGFVDDAVASEWVATAPESATRKAVGRSSTARLEPEISAVELATFETPLFGADRQKLLHALLAEFAERCLVSRDASGRLNGFLIARDPLLGPWCASSPAVAEELLSAALRLTRQHPPLVQVPRSNQAACQLLNSHGFTERRRLRHMRRGGSQPVGVPQRLFGQSSFGHG